MKTALVLLSLAAFAAAVPLTFGVGKTVTIDEDGTITITSELGKKIVINKAIGQPGPKDVEITLGGPYGPTRKIQIDGETNTRTFDLLGNLEDLTEEDRSKRASIKDTKESSKSSKSAPKTQQKTDLLSQLIQEYQGVVDAKSYNDLVAKVNTAVQNGDLNPSVWDLLRSLNQYKLAEKYGVQQVTPMNWQYPTGVYPYGNQQGEFLGQQQLEPVNPWATYWQSVVQQKQLTNPWIALRRPTPAVDSYNY